MLPLFGTSDSANRLFGTGLMLAAGGGYSLFGGWAAAKTASRFGGRPAPAPVGTAGCVFIVTSALICLRDPIAVAAGLALGWSLVVLTFTDAMIFRLPDAVTLPLILFGLLWRAARPGDSSANIISPLIGAASGFGLFAVIAWGYRALRGRDGLGLGDAKLAGAAGAWLGWEHLPLVILLASVSGLAWFAAARLFARTKIERLAFGIPLCAAIWIVFLYANSNIPFRRSALNESTIRNDILTATAASERAVASREGTAGVRRAIADLGHHHPELQFCFADQSE